MWRHLQKARSCCRRRCQCHCWPLFRRLATTRPRYSSLFLNSRPGAWWISSVQLHTRHQAINASITPVKCPMIARCVRTYRLRSIHPRFGRRWWRCPRESSPGSSRTKNRRLARENKPAARSPTASRTPSSSDSSLHKYNVTAVFATPPTQHCIVQRKLGQPEVRASLLECAIHRRRSNLKSGGTKKNIGPRIRRLWILKRFHLYIQNTVF